jgi:chemotaxis-related protein WspD
MHCRNCSVFSTAGQELFERETPPELLDEWTRQLAETNDDTVAETLSVLVFRIGAEWLALDTQRAVELVEPRSIHRVPHRTDRLLLGLANIRGELLLCISLHELLQIDAPDGDATPHSTLSSRPKQRLLVAEHDQNHWAFPVDEAEGVVRIPTIAMEDLPHTVQRSPRYYSQALLSHAGKRIGMLSGTRLFEALERTIR